MEYNNKCELNQKKWTLEQFKEWQEICLHCGACVAHGPIIPHNNEELPPDEWQSPEHKCPSLEYYKLKTFSGQGRLLLTAALFNNRTKISEELVNIMFTCNSCGVCDEICPPYLPMHVTLACREEINETVGVKLPEPLPELFENMDIYKNLFGLKKRSKATPNLPKTGKDMYFTGCYTSYLLPNIGYTNVELMKAGGLDLCHMGIDESCCGEVARQAGNRKLFEKIAREQIGKVQEAGATRVICSCAHCYKTWKEEYPRAIQAELPFEVVHITDVLAELIKEGKLKPIIPIKKEITYHDPCFLRGNHQNPRMILESIPGIQLNEMSRHGRWSYCCGAGAKIALNCYPDYAASIGKERIEEAAEAADQVVTACPVCYNQLRFSQKEEEIKIEVEDISVLLAKSCGLGMATQNELEVWK